MVDINLCLYEALSPCGGRSCQHNARPNLYSPLVVSGPGATLVGVDIQDDYVCDCGPLEPLPSVCYDGFCHNGGTCALLNHTLTCHCPDSYNYGPRCELKTARFEKGFIWLEPPSVCDSPNINMVLKTESGNGVLLYAGPIVPLPWDNYPKDFMYLILKNWHVEAYIDFGFGTVHLSVPVVRDTGRHFHVHLGWTEAGVTLDVRNCGFNITARAPEPCKIFHPFAFRNLTTHLLNIQGPLQVKT